MMLSDVSLPVDLAWVRLRALVFSPALAQRIAEVQDEVGDTRYRLTPQELANGNYFVGADLLTECVPGSWLYPAFSRLDQSQFDQIAVVPMSEVARLLPVPETPEVE